MPSYNLAVAALRAAAALGTAAALQTSCATPATTNTTTPATAPASNAPMVVDGPSSQRDGTVTTQTTLCIPANTTPFDLNDADYVIEVAADGTGLAQHSPCPSGPIIDTF